MQGCHRIEAPGYCSGKWADLSSCSRCIVHGGSCFAGGETGRGTGERGALNLPSRHSSWHDGCRPSMDTADQGPGTSTSSLEPQRLAPCGGPAGLCRGDKDEAWSCDVTADAANPFRPSHGCHVDPAGLLASACWQSASNLHHPTPCWAPCWDAKSTRCLSKIGYDIALTVDVLSRTQNLVVEALVG